MRLLVGFFVLKSFIKNPTAFTEVWDLLFYAASLIYTILFRLIYFIAPFLMFRDATKEVVWAILTYGITLMFAGITILLAGLTILLAAATILLAGSKTLLAGCPIGVAGCKIHFAGLHILFAGCPFLFAGGNILNEGCHFLFYTDPSGNV